MVTNYAQSIAVGRHVTRETHEEEGFSGRVFDRLRQMMCGLHGHDALVQFEHDRMFLRCVSCGHETQGWDLHDIRPAVPLRVETPRKALSPQPMIGERKIA